ncbi:hypothetical protein B0H34DRAFT_672890 [Crassisporium funariophilum]|nr:hypothetical protein B0H34DRAFT_672890 [Crassisporium funariophilum]
MHQQRANMISAVQRNLNSKLFMNHQELVAMNDIDLTPQCSSDLNWGPSQGLLNQEGNARWKEVTNIGMHSDFIKIRREAERLPNSDGIGHGGGWRARVAKKRGFGGICIFYNLCSNKSITYKAQQLAVTSFISRKEAAKIEIDSDDIKFKGRRKGRQRVMVLKKWWRLESASGEKERFQMYLHRLQPLLQDGHRPAKYNVEIPDYIGPQLSRC